jgi:hypothetical protein
VQVARRRRRRATRAPRHEANRAHTLFRYVGLTEPAAPLHPPRGPPPGGGAPSTAALLALAGDQVAEALDAKHGAEVTDQSIYRAHAAKYEVGLAAPRRAAPRRAARFGLLGFGH